MQSILQNPEYHNREIFLHLKTSNKKLTLKLKKYTSNFLLLKVNDYENDLLKDEPFFTPASASETHLYTKYIKKQNIIAPFVTKLVNSVHELLENIQNENLKPYGMLLLDVCH